MRHKPTELESIKPGNSSKRRRLTLKGEFVLALMPTLVILTVLALVEVLDCR